jgi:hypothetical protein
VIPSTEAIHGGGTDREEILVAGGADVEEPGVVETWQLHVQGHAQPFRADVIEESSQEGESIPFLHAISGTSGSPDGALNSLPATIEYDHGMFAMIASGLDELVEDGSLLFLACLAVASLKLLEIRTIRLAHEKSPF